MLAINTAIRRIANTASVDTLFAFIRRNYGGFIRQLELAALRRRVEAHPPEGDRPSIEKRIGYDNE